MLDCITGISKSVPVLVSSYWSSECRVLGEGGADIGFETEFSYRHAIKKKKTELIILSTNDFFNYSKQYPNVKHRVKMQMKAHVEQ